MSTDRGFDKWSGGARTVWNDGRAEGRREALAELAPLWMAERERAASPAAANAGGLYDAAAWCVANPNGESPPVLIYGNGAVLKPGDKLYLRPTAVGAGDLTSEQPELAGK